MVDMKTRATDASVDGFLRSIPDDARRQDCLRVLEIMKSVTGDEPKLENRGQNSFSRTATPSKSYSDPCSCGKCARRGS